MKSKTLVWILPAAVMLLAGAAAGHWEVNDGHKMHFPQLPDVQGWDVNATYPKVLADDWQCSQTGPVTDIHFWGSWQQDLVGQITGFVVQIYSNIPAVPGAGFSQPGELLWQRTIEDFSIRPYDPAAQEGWFDPNTGFFNVPDHASYFQYNLTPIPDPFLQERGKIYWLAVSALVQPGPAQEMWGWKTSLNHFEDDAVWGDFLPNGGGITPWQELIDPITGESLDLAFVITPEPGSWVLFVLGLLFMRREHDRKLGRRG